MVFLPRYARKLPLACKNRKPSGGKPASPTRCLAVQMVVAPANHKDPAKVTARHLVSVMVTDRLDLVKVAMVLDLAMASARHLAIVMAMGHMDLVTVVTAPDLAKVVTVPDQVDQTAPDLAKANARPPANVTVRARMDHKDHMALATMIL